MAKNNKRPYQFMSDAELIKRHIKNGKITSLLVLFGQIGAITCVFNAILRLITFSAFTWTIVALEALCFPFVIKYSIDKSKTEKEISIRGLEQDVAFAKIKQRQEQKQRKMQKRRQKQAKTKAKIEHVDFEVIPRGDTFDIIVPESNVNKYCSYIDNPKNTDDNEKI